MGETSKLFAITTSFEKPQHAESVAAKIYNVATSFYHLTSSETLGFIVLSYERTILNHALRAIYNDSIVSVITDQQALHTHAGLRRVILEGSGLPADLMADAFIGKGVNPNHPAPIISRDGNTHLLHLLGRGRGRGYINYITQQYGGADKAA